MTDHALLLNDLKDRIMAEPDVILEDRDVMRALIAANERRLGSNIVDLRGIAMERLEARLDRLEDTHRSVIAAAYENLAGTNQIHRAVLELLEPVEFTDFLKSLGTTIAETLRVEKVRLVLEAEQTDTDPLLEPLEGVLSAVPVGFVDALISEGRAIPSRKVTLRQVSDTLPELYGDKAGFIRSEALLKLDFGPNRLPGLLVLGAEDPHQFRPNQGTDLLAFLASVFERALLRWLS